MRVDTPEFAALNTASKKNLRLVVRIIFDVSSIYITSDPDMTNTPGDTMLGYLQDVSAVSQSINPDEGRSTIGSMSFSLVDIDGDMTDALRTQLQSEFQNLRGRTAQLLIGYTEDFNDAVLQFTQQVRAAEYDDGSYHITCNDVQREQRKQIHEPKVTNLRLTITKNTTSIPVFDTSEFQTINHDAYYTDAPNVTCGYVRIDDEIVRWRTKTSNSLDSCTRGVFKTEPVSHEIEADAADERQPEVEEVIYLEGPGPKLALATMTGQYNNGTLPEHWFMGIDPAIVT